MKLGNTYKGVNNGSINRRGIDDSNFYSCNMAGGEEMISDLYAKWYMVWLAKMFGTKRTSFDYTKETTYSTTGYYYKGRMYITDCKAIQQKGSE